MNKTIALLLSMLLAGNLQAQEWPLKITQEMKPGTRWWWMGSAVDKQNITWNLEQYARQGIGTIEITPIYGVKGNEKNNIDYLSAPWMEILKHTQQEAGRLGMETDMNNGTGWPFGGPWVKIEDAACKVIVIDTVLEYNHDILKAYHAAEALDKKEIPYAKKVCQRVYRLPAVYYKNGKLLPNGVCRVITLFQSRTLQQVKRAAPGGQGYVIDYFSKRAVKRYLKHFENAFKKTGTPYPAVFFNDSYEVFGADWTPGLLKAFKKRRGYALEEHLEEFVDEDEKVIGDYRETLGELLLENFMEQWTAWAHRHGSLTRSQAHGSPANLIDCYAAVDIPETEGFGLTDFGINGLRTDSGFTRENDADFSMLKYAASAAHITGKKLVSSETFTWLTEHFRTSLSQLKPDMDLMFCAGINRMFFHGTTYSPKEAAWPGWKFYASIDMSPTNSIWKDAPYFMEYVQRCQSFLQWGTPNNDFLVYLPIRAIWKDNPSPHLLHFSIHQMGKLAPNFIKSILKIDSLGYDCDYISDRYLMTTKYENGHLSTCGKASYKALIINDFNALKEETLKHVLQLRKQGAIILSISEMKKMTEVAAGEELKTKMGLKMIRRKNDEGYHYFIANLTPEDKSGYVRLSVPFQNALIYNPIDGSSLRALTNDKHEIYLSLRSGESIILQTLNSKTASDNTISTSPKSLLHTFDYKIALQEGWKLSFEASIPTPHQTYDINHLSSWEHLDDTTKILMGTGIYRLSFHLPAEEVAREMHWQLELGDVRESARVYINDSLIGCAWAVPFSLSFNNLLHEGFNSIRIEVTNLPANRIAHLDSKGTAWRKFEEINMVDINYQKTNYANWQPAKSGLIGPIVLYGKVIGR